MISDTLDTPLGFVFQYSSAGSVACVDTMTVTPIPWPFRVIDLSRDARGPLQLQVPAGMTTVSPSTAEVTTKLTALRLHELALSVAASAAPPPARANKTNNFVNLINRPPVTLPALPSRPIVAEYLTAQSRENIRDDRADTQHERRLHRSRVHGAPQSVQGRYHLSQSGRVERRIQCGCGITRFEGHFHWSVAQESLNT